jgi:quercetin dioxygenase-like cupin family protein
MKINDFITQSEKLEWQPLIENGIHYRGVFVKSLRYDAEKKRSRSILLKFEKDASYPYHIHPAGEEILVLDGSCIIVDETLNKGDFLYTPPDEKHSVTSKTGCVLFLSIPEEVVLLNHPITPRRDIFNFKNK